MKFNPNRTEAVKNTGAVWMELNMIIECQMTFGIPASPTTIGVLNSQRQWNDGNI